VYLLLSGNTLAFDQRKIAYI